MGDSCQRRRMWLPNSAYPLPLWTPAMSVSVFTHTHTHTHTDTHTHIYIQQILHSIRHIALGLLS